MTILGRIDIEREKIFGPRTKILFIGCTHWKKFGMDAVNPDFRSFTESELKEFLQVIDKFRPTIVCNEANVEETDKMQQLLEQYFENNMDLKDPKYAWEGYQLGFRISKRYNLKNIYGIDNQSDENAIDFDSIFKMASIRGL